MTEIGKFNEEIKVGDRVVINDRYDSPHNGVEGEVLEVYKESDDDCDRFKVKLDEEVTSILADNTDIIYPIERVVEKVYG